MSEKEKNSQKAEPKLSYEQVLKQQFMAIIESLKLEALQKKYLQQRWLDQVMWMEGKAGKAQKPYYLLRVVTIVGGVIVPALVGLNTDNSILLRNLTVLLSLIVASSAAIEGFFKYGERWRHYRATVELLKSEGWNFFGLTGVYGNFSSHSDAFNHFSNSVESLIRADVEAFISKIAKEAEKTKKV